MTRASDKPLGALTPGRALRAAEILEQALDAPPSQQLDVVRAASGGDEAMEREVLSLLGAHANAGAFLQPPLRGATLEPGTLLGTYRVIERIGAGGMGEVYRARDEVLGRSVAIKVLSDERARDASHVARLEREARSLAALNHPNIAAIYAVQSARDGHGPALVLELATGKTLAQVLERGPLAVDDAVAIATQVARALEAAHGAGIVHRDLKPANVAIADDGTVKVLDFGLAKSTNEVEIASGSGAGLSPVVTQVGMLVGTVAYMSPEQARGKAIDRRADMWAFGCVLYEMLAGKRLLTGDDVGEVFRKVVAGEVNLDGLPAGTPARVRRVIERCLRKELDRRMRDAGDARVELEEPLASDGVPEQAKASKRMWWVVAAAAIAAAAGATGIVASMRGETKRPVLNEQYSVLLPEGSPLIHHSGSPVSMRAGTRDLYYNTYAPSGDVRVACRRAKDGRLDFDGFAIGDACGAISPDGQRLIYWSSLNGAVTIAIRDLESGADIAHREVLKAWNGIAWVNEWTVAVAQSMEEERLVFWDFREGRSWVPPNIGRRDVVQPAGVGDGRTVVFSMHEAKAGQRTRDVFAWREELPEPVKVVSDAQMPKVMGGDVLLFYRGDGVQAVKFDANTLRTVGPEVNVLSGLAPDTELITCGMYDVTSDGDLLYVPTTQTYEGAKLVWVAENGDQQELEQIESRMLALRLSYDATKIAYVAGGKSPTLFVHDLTRGTNWPVAEGFVVLPIWTRDGEFIIYEYAPDNGAPQELRSVRSDGSAPPQTLVQLPPKIWAQPTDVTPDGKYMIVSRLVGPRDETDIFRVAIDGSGEWEPIFMTYADRTNARLSADGSMIAYTSKESGEWAVYVQPYPSMDRKIRVSPQSAFRLSWQPDSNRLFFRGSGEVYSVDADATPTLRVSEPELRFSGLPESRFDAALGGTRIVQAVPLKKSTSLHEVRVWLGAEAEIRSRLDAAARAAQR
jgi:serine/threonine-protein kinase